MLNQPRTPATIVTGFIGSGKTTLISYWIDELQARGQQVVYIKNEIGDLDLDGQLLQARGVVSRELLNGCICCTLVGPFTSSITEVVEMYHPDRIIIEASGTADPAALALMVSSHPLLWREAVVSIIDVLNFEGFEDLSTTAQVQTKFTDLLIFNKVELADQQRKERVVGYVRELNQHSPIIEAHNGKVPIELIFGLAHTELDSVLSNHEQHEHTDHHDHLEQDNIQGISLTPPNDWHREQWDAWLLELPKTVFRIKGIIRIGETSWLLNSVAGRADWRILDQTAHTIFPRLIVIGYQVQHLKKQLESSLLTTDIHS